MRNHRFLVPALVGLGALGACAPNPNHHAPTPASPVGSTTPQDEMVRQGTVTADEGGTFGWQDGRFPLGGTISGLVGSGLVLRANGGEPLAVTANGTFRFPEGTRAFSIYDIGIAAQPVRPWQRCQISAPRGRADGPIVDLAVVCTMHKYIVGGTVTGLRGKLTIENTRLEEITMSYDMAFQFMEQVQSGANYDVRVKEQPPGQHCVVQRSSDVVDGADRRDVAIRCEAVSCVNRGWKTGSQDWTCPAGYRLPVAGEHDAIAPCLTAADDAKLSSIADVGIARGGCGCSWNPSFCDKPSIDTMNHGRACGDYPQLHVCVRQ